MSECPICYEAIDATTGLTTLSCSHSFHFSCIAGWFSKLEKGTCPCCRKEMHEKEDMPQAEDDDYEDDSEDEDEDEVEFTRESLDAFLRARGGGLTDQMAESICSDFAAFTANELNALLIGNTGRALTEEEWDYLVNMDEEQWNSGITITSHLQDDGTWTREVLNPEEISVVSVSLPANVSVPEATNKAATKVQAVWRGYKERRNNYINILLSLGKIEIKNSFGCDQTIHEF